MVILTFVSCVTLPKGERRVGPLSEGEWAGKVLVTDKQQNRNYTLVLDLIARQPSLMRMDITTGFGTHVASLVLNNDRVSYLLSREKRFVSGPAKPDVMAKLIGIPIDPNVVHKILLQSPITDPDWTCRLDAQKQPVLCQHRNGALSIEWTAHEATRRLIEIRTPGVDLKMSLNDVRAKVEPNEAIFTLKPPRGFKIESVR